MITSPNVPNNGEVEDIPEGAFIGSKQLEGKVVLETAIDNSVLVDQEPLLAVWAQLSAVSVEAALVGRPDILDFANSHCLLFAAIRTPVTVVLPASADLASLGLPDHAAVVWTDSPILPSDASAIYASVDAYYEQTHPEPRPPLGDAEQNAQSSSSPSSDGALPMTRRHKAVFEWKTIGIVYVTMSPIPHEVHIGVALLPAFRRQGAGMKACAFAVQWALETIRAHRVQARILTSPDRSRAQRLFTALGFAHEGIQRRAVTDAAGAWADVTHMGIVDTDWLVRRRLRAAPRNMWDELFERHQREREELLRWEESRGKLRRTSSMETVRGEPDSKFDVPEALSGDESDAQYRSASPAPSTSSSIASQRPVQPKGEESESPEEHSWGSPLSVPQSDGDDPFSDSEWVISSPRSDISRSSGDPISRPLSAASWSSFESIGSGVSSTSSTRGIVEDWSQMSL